MKSVQSFNNVEHIKLMESLEHIIFSLNEINIENTTQEIMKLFDQQYPYSFNNIICQFLFYTFISKKNCPNICFDFLKSLEEKQIEIDQNIPKIFQIFSNFLVEIQSQESYFLIEKMIKQNLIESDIVRRFKTFYFIHRLKGKLLEEFYGVPGFFDDPYYHNNIPHEQYIEEGVNTNGLSKIIRYDEIEKLQEISSQIDFDYNQKIEPSLYERYSFINHENVTLIDYAVFFNSIKCFKFLLINGANIENTLKYAIAGGNEEIVHLCEQKHSILEDAYETAIEFHRNDIFHYFYEKKPININLTELGIICIKYNNYEIFSFLLKEGMKVDDVIVEEFIRRGNVFFFIGYKKRISNSSFPLSVESGNIEFIKYLLNREGIDVNAMDKDGNKALMIASKKGHTEIVKLLLEQEGIDINDKDYYGNTALILASSKGHIEIVKLLLEQEGIDINAKDVDRKTALMHAIYYRKIFKLLLEQEGIDINAKDVDGKTALICASADIYIHPLITKLLLEQKGIEINAKDQNGKTALMKAASHWNIEIIKLLLEQKEIDINTKDNQGNTALILATRSNDVEGVKIILMHSEIDINAHNEEGNTSLIIASSDGNMPLVKIFLEQKGIDINAKGNNGSALFNAYKNQHIDVFNFLIQQEGIDINTKHNGDTLLLDACCNSDIELIKFLLDQKGIDVNDKGANGRTALMCACTNGFIEAVTLLLNQKEIDINAKDDDGLTALMRSSNLDNAKILELLLQQKEININESDIYGWTPLIYASSGGCLENVKLLLEFKEININSRDEEGKTALQYATEAGNDDIVELLLQQKGIELN